MLRCAALLLLAVGPSTLAAQDTVEWAERMGPGDVLTVKNITGDIRVVLARGTTAEVVAEKSGRERDFEYVEVRVEEERDGFTICAVYDRPDSEGCDWQGDRERNRDDRQIRARVQFEVRLPAGVEFIGTTVTGDVLVRDVESEVTASTVTGDIEVSTTGVAHAGNVSGDIDVEMGSLEWSDLSFNTVSGDITLRLPRGLDTDVEFESLSGDIDSDFELRTERTRRRLVGSRVSGTIGSGGRTLSFNTVSGSVRLLRGRS